MNSKAISVYVSPKDVEALDKLVEIGYFKSRSDAVTVAIRKLLETKI